MTGRLKVYDEDAAAWRYVDSVVPTVGTPAFLTAVAADYTSSSTTYVDIGALWTLDIVAPASGNVLLLGNIEMNNPNAAAIADGVVGYRVGAGADVDCGAFAFNSATDGATRHNVTLGGLITGLTPGVTYTVKLRWKCSSGTAMAYNGSSRGGAQVGSRLILLPLP